MGANLKTGKASWSIEGRTFGIELEIVGLDRHAAWDALTAANIRSYTTGYTHAVSADSWKVVNDGSVPGGCEVVSPVLRGADGIAQAVRVADALTAAGARVNSTCGMHVHVGVSDYDASALGRLLAAAVKYESTIDLLVAPSRRGNNSAWCRSNNTASGIGDVAAVNATIARLQAAKTIDAIRGIYRHGRYYKVNCEAYARYQTIEFRQHQGSLNGDKIANWVTLLVSMVEACKVRKVYKLRAGQTSPAKRLEVFLNAYVQGDVRKWFSKRMRELNPGMTQRKRSRGERAARPAAIDYTNAPSQNVPTIAEVCLTGRYPLHFAVAAAQVDAALAS